MVKIFSMKKVFILLAAALTIFAACHKAEISVHSVAPDEIHASIEDLVPAKTMMNGDKRVCWTAGDQIVVFFKNSIGLRYQVDAESVGKSSATFNRVQDQNVSNNNESSEFDHNIAYYPYSSSVECQKSGSEYLLYVYIPEDQSYMEKSFGPESLPMVSVSENDDITFKNVCGGMKLQLMGEQKVSSIRLEGKNSEKLAGAASITAYFANTAPVITMSSDAVKTVTLNCGAGVQLSKDTATEFIISLPPTVFSKGFSVTVTDSDNHTYIVDTDKENSVLRSSLLVMPPVDLDDFNTGGMLDIEEKEGYNVYGLVSCNGVGVPGVVISDGVEVTVTDDNGVYYLDSEEYNQVVFMSVPSGYEVESEGVLPKFYKNLDGDARTRERADWSLTKVDNDDHVMYVLGDMHLANRTNDLNQFADFASDLNEQISLNNHKRQYALTLGDMTWDRYWYEKSYDLSTYKKTINSHFSNIQFFHTIGNHDHDMNAAGDFNTVSLFKNVLAPNYYSFNIGNVHYVVMDDILCTNDGSGVNSRTYDKKFTTEQLEWLRKDLEFVDRSKKLVLAMHAQMYSENGSIALTNGSTIEEIVSGYETHVMSAHTHVIWNNDKIASKGIYHHNSGAICATWWWTGYYTPGFSLCKDGSPGGYYIYTMNEQDVKWRFKPIGKSVNYAFRTYDRNVIRLTAATYAPNANANNASAFEKSASDWLSANNENYVYFNIFDYDPSWTIEVKENGKVLPYESVTIKDPLHMIAYEAKRYNENSSPTSDFKASKVSSHIFRVKASSATSTLEFKVTDRFGMQSKETMVRPKAFSIGTYNTSIHSVSGEDSFLIYGE